MPVATTHVTLAPASTGPVAVLIVAPKPALDTRARIPVVLFSHGDGRAPEDYDPLLRFWADAGLLVLCPSHRRTPGDPFHWLQRIRELHAVAEMLDPIEAALPHLTGRLDRARLRVAGHSFGGHSAGALLGARPPAALTPAGEHLSHPRVTSGVLLAPPGDGDAASLSETWRLRAPYLDTDWSAIDRPVLVVAGTRDVGEMSPRDWRWRSDAFTRLPTGRGRLLVMPGADHFLGGIATGGVKNEAALARLRRVTTAMLLDERLLAPAPAAQTPIYA